MTLPELVTYVIAPILAGLTAVWALVKIVVPRMVEARLEEQRDTREHTQSLQRLEQAYHLSEGAVAQQMIAEILANTQEAKERSDDFTRNEVREAIRRLEVLAADIPDIREDIQKIKYEFRQQATQIRIMVGLISELYDSDKQTPNRPRTKGGRNDD